MHAALLAQAVDYGIGRAFSDIAGASAMGRPEELAVGIGLALLTTAVGLSIAIPALTLYMFLASRVDTLVMEMDDVSQNVVQMISAEAIAAREQLAPRKRAMRTRTATAVESAEA